MSEVADFHTKQINDGKRCASAPSDRFSPMARHYIITQQWTTPECDTPFRQLSLPVMCVIAGMLATLRGRLIVVYPGYSYSPVIPKLHWLAISSLTALTDHSIQALQNPFLTAKQRGRTFKIIESVNLRTIWSVWEKRLEQTPSRKADLGWKRSNNRFFGPFTRNSQRKGYTL